MRIIKILIISVFAFLAVNCSGQNFFWSHRAGVAAELEYVNNGGIVYEATASSIDVPYPSTISSGNLLVIILHVKQDDIFGAITSQSGFTLLNYVDTNDDLVAAWFYKIADGTESGTATINHNFFPTNGEAAAMFQYTGFNSVDASSSYIHAAETNVYGGSTSVPSGYSSVAGTSTHGVRTPTVASPYVLDALLTTTSGGGFTIAVASTRTSGTNSLTWDFGPLTRFSIYARLHTENL